MLPRDLTHYVVPDVGVVADYLEILEFRELQGIVFTQTACQAAQHSKGRRYARTNTLNRLIRVLDTCGILPANMNISAFVASAEVSWLIPRATLNLS